MLLVGKTTLMVNEVSIALLEMENMKGPNSSHRDQVLAVKYAPDRGNICHEGGTMIRGTIVRSRECGVI